MLGGVLFGKEKAETRHSQPQTVTLACFVYKHKAEPKVVWAQEGKPVIKISCCMHVKAEMPSSTNVSINSKVILRVTASN